MPLCYVNALKYKKWANIELLTFGEHQLHLLSKSDATFFIRILNHTTVVDSLFISRLLDEPEQYEADNTVETPTLPELRHRMEKNDLQLILFAESLLSNDLNRIISFQFIDDDFGELSVEEILMHLLTHGSNHRGMASRVLFSNELDRPRDTFTRYLHELEPLRREGHHR